MLLVISVILRLLLFYNFCHLLVDSMHVLFDYLVAVLNAVICIHAKADHPVLCLLCKPDAASGSAAVVIIPQPLGVGQRATLGLNAL